MILLESVLIDANYRKSLKVHAKQRYCRKSNLNNGRWENWER
jgi:hypothetical protein